MFETNNPKQPFFITNRVDIFPKDLRILIKLYQPLIGSLPLALYLSLNEDYNAQAMLSDAKGIYTLQEQTDCDIKKLFGALHKLEAVGLIQTRLLDNQIMGHVLCFEIKNVPASSEFFSTALLASLLKEKVGITAFNKLSHEFAREAKQNRSELSGIKGAPNISASFMDVFHLSDQEAIDPSIEVKEAARENNYSASDYATVNDQDNIDWDFMKQQFEIYQIAGSEIDQNKEAIRAVMRIYGLSEQEFVDEAIPCLHGDYQLNMREIKQTIANSIHGSDTRRHLQDKAKIPEKFNKSDSQLNQKEQKLLQKAQTDTPAQFLYHLKTERNDYVDASEYQVLDSLYNDKGISAELLNVLTYACLKSSPNISFRLANKILHDWLQHGIKTGAQALDYMEKRKRTQEQRRENRLNQFKQRSRNKKKIEKNIDWDSRKSKAISNESNLSSNELEKFFKKLEDRNGMK
ncbi:DnaD domain protein [Lactobacillus kullabergensis]|uniref:Chromosome replication initiation protein n=1 Tax=Lactobacillus kullabergensis TaxID=1218493 RepID=A0ABN5LDB8_9LACO|nr:DnaD domain protein [Lactobacillus kullabergensis]AWM75583.1 chromosome replication initiation protein [Lactobacillus kullabergensis]